MKEIKEGKIVNYRTPTGDIIEIEIKSLWDNKDSKGHDMVYKKQYDTGGSLYSLGKQKNIIVPKINKHIFRGDIFGLRKKDYSDICTYYYILVQVDFKPEFMLISLDTGNRYKLTPYFIDLTRKEVVDNLNKSKRLLSSEVEFEYVDIDITQALKRQERRDRDGHV